MNLTGNCELLHNHNNVEAKQHCRTEAALTLQIRRNISALTLQIWLAFLCVLIFPILPSSLFLDSYTQKTNEIQSWTKNFQ